MMSKQQFQRGWRVRIADVLPQFMDHFPGKGQEAIVRYTFGQKGLRDARYRNTDPATVERHHHEYALLLLTPSGEVLEAVSWYPENVLTLVSADRDTGLALIENWEYPT